MNRQKNKNKISKKENIPQAQAQAIQSSTINKKILLFPGEEYDFNEKLIHYDAFGFSNGNLISKKCGILLSDRSGKVVEDNSEEIYRSIGRYYSPKEEDFVIGIIVQKSSEIYKVDIGSYTYAILNTKDFEGATKKLKPNLNMGDVIFARVLKVNKFDAPTLSCISESGSKSWSSGESFFGGLNGGNLFDFPKIHAIELYKENFAIKRLNDVANFELVIGMNGKLWINSDSIDNIYTIYDILIKSFKLEDNEVEKIIHDAYINKLK